MESECYLFDQLYRNYWVIALRIFFYPDWPFHNCTPPPSYLLFESSPCYWSIPSNRDLLFSLSFSFFFLPLPLHPCDLYLHPTPQSCNRSPAFLYSPQQLAVSHFNLTSQRRLMGKVYTTSFGVRENLLVGTATRSWGLGGGGQYLAFVYIPAPPDQPAAAGNNYPLKNIRWGDMGLLSQHRRKRDRSIPGACWPANLAILVSCRFKERACIKKVR